ncbi:hypothetical protein FGO68_gene972 [Halteria grandinella]|uniref:Uncharacterized protein n=1 Tax=Halteria grandinella TaxID=5974 RepID=A0A8J8P4L0_HALGN|nr:hypothetical protein FGO68_gene972 [Halteria grandinella]
MISSLPQIQAPPAAGNAGNHYLHRRCRCKMVRLIAVHGQIFQQFPHYMIPAGEEAKVDLPIMPLQGIKYEISAQNSIIKSKLMLTYINDSESKVEAKLEMPSNPDLVISQMKIKVGDVEITGVIKNKEKAKEMFEDAVSRGHQAGLLQMKEEEEDKILEMNVGNIEPKQVVEVSISFIEQAKIFEGAYQIYIPRGLVLLMTECSKQNTQVNVQITCSSMISNVYCPKFFTKTDCELVKKKAAAEERHTVTLTLDGEIPESEGVNIYYSTYEADKPQILAQANPETKEVALMVSLLPTFNPDPQDLMGASAIQIDHEDLPMEADLPNKLIQNFFVIFLVDRSGSMSGKKMDITKEALHLFIKSLPSENCLFQIISFGTNYNFLETPTCKKGQPLEYNQENLDIATQKIDRFSANMAGTNIYEPLQKALEIEPSDKKFTNQSYRKVIFLLTDGETEKRDQCLTLVQDKRDKDTTVVNTFGIGDCDKFFVDKVAELGDGICVTLGTEEVNKLKSKVIEILSQSLKPSLKDFKTKFTFKQGSVAQHPILQAKALKNTTEVFRNQLYSEYFILNSEQYEECKNSDLTFEISFTDPLKQTKAVIKVDKGNILQVEDGSTISKLAAHYRFSNYQDPAAQRIANSTKYQVLCKDTALIAVVKNLNTDEALSTAEVKQISLTQSSLSPFRFSAFPPQNFGLPHGNLFSGMPFGFGGRGGSRGGRGGGRGAFGFPQANLMLRNSNYAAPMRLCAANDSDEEDEDNEEIQLESLNMAQPRGTQLTSSQPPKSRSRLKCKKRSIAPEAERSRQRSRSRSLDRDRGAREERQASVENDLAKNLIDLFDRIIKQQRVDGSWSDKSLVASYLATCCEKPGDINTLFGHIQSEIGKLIKDGKTLFDMESVLITLTIIAILNAKFKSRRAEWNLIERKAKKYITSLQGGLLKVESLLASFRIPV